MLCLSGFELLSRWVPLMLSLEQINLSVSDFKNFVDNSLRGYLKGRCDNFRAGCVSDSLQA